MNIEDLQKEIDKIMNEQNDRGIPDFEGYSPNEMTQILYSTFEKDSKIILQELTDEEYNKIPILNQIKYLMNLISESGELKLTATGALPPKVVSELYNQGFLVERTFEAGISKLTKEIDSITVSLTRILTELSGIAKKRAGKLSLTKKGEKLLKDNSKLLELIFKTFTTKFSWAYYDYFKNNQIGQFGFGFSLILISKYGNKRQDVNYFAEKYLIAFPNLVEDKLDEYFESFESQSYYCYSVRTFNRFLDYFSLISIDKSEKDIFGPTYIKKTELFDKLIKIVPPAGQYKGNKTIN
ncbi:MAG: hypothetical protein WC121_01800 [Candidatus Kapaibacterium sp.]